MLQQLCERNGIQTNQSKRRYFSYTVVWFCIAMALGSLCVLSEQREWIPRTVSQLFLLPNEIVNDFSLLRLCGVLFSSTIIVPALFWAGVHPVGYHYTARIFLFIFWFFQGAEIWQCLFLLHQNTKTVLLSVILLLIWTLCVGFLLLRIHAVATAGIRCGTSSGGLRPSLYWGKLPKYWGALMIFRTLFYAIYALIC